MGIFTSVGSRTHDHTHNKGSPYQLNHREFLIKLAKNMGQIRSRGSIRPRRQRLFILRVAHQKPKEEKETS